MIPPHPHTYWVDPKRLLAGEYPISLEPVESRVKLLVLLEVGVRIFVDLTSVDDGLLPYDELLEELSKGEAKRFSFPVPDLGVPESPEFTRSILDVMDEHLAAGRVVYVHCWGGIGRTGTVIGCWLARHFPDQDAQEQLSRVWSTCRKSLYSHSPETREQRDYIRHWREL